MLEIVLSPRHSLYYGRHYLRSQNVSDERDRIKYVYF